MIIKKEDGYYLMTKDGTKKLGGPFITREQALEREQEIQVWAKMRAADSSDTIKGDSHEQDKKKQ